MDPLSLLGEGETKSIPQEVKSDRESLDDFEHVVREPLPADQNLQFINIEKGQFETEGAVKEGEKVVKDSPGKASPEPAGFKNSDDPLASSKNFMHYDQVTEKKDELEDFLKGEIKRTPEPEGHDDSDSQADDDSIVTPAPAKLPEPQKSPSPEPVKAPTPEPIKAPEPAPARAKTHSPEPEPVVAEPTPKVPEHKYESDEEPSAPPAPVPRDYPEIGVIEPRDILTAFGLYAWFHPERLNPKVEALVYWRDPKKSGIVFGSVLVVLLSLTVCSLISVVAYTSLTVLTAAISFRIYKTILQAVQKTSEGHPFNTYILPVLQNPLVSAVFQSIAEYLDLDLTLSPERVRDVTDVTVTHINSAIVELRRRFLVEDLVDSLKFGLLLYVLTYIGSWFNGLTLIILGFVALFTLPKVYENNQQQIDANLDLVRAKINEVTDKIKAIIPLGKKTEEAKTKDD